MTPDTPVDSIDDCFAYLASNQWQFPMLPPDARVTINAKMLRSLYFHIGCLKFGVPMEGDIAALGGQLKQLTSKYYR